MISAISNVFYLTVTMKNAKVIMVMILRILVMVIMIKNSGYYNTDSKITPVITKKF